MKDPQEAISKAISIIAGVLTNTPLFPTSKPSGENPDEYIVVNTLPLPNDVLQITILNVNIHAKDVDGYPNLKRLNEISALVKPDFEDYKPSEPNYIDFHLETQHTLPEVALKEHYTNLRYKVYLLN